MPNISIVQSPSTAFSVIGPLKKIVFGLAGGGIALGIGLAILLELVLNRTVKRPLELETLLGTPLLLSVPYLNGRRARRLNGKNRLRLGGLDAIGKALAPVQQKRDSHVAPWDFDHPIRRFAETIRDRLILYFELNQMNHKPKLVAVTGLSEGAGTSTIGAGLAAALSETGDGKVLLVDMNGRPEAHSFSMGAPACSLSDALVGDPAPAGENLYLAVAGSADRRRSQVIPKRFYDLMPHLKASDFDYIIFDMPPLGQTSVTLPMARFMDKVLVVAEAEATDRDFVKRAYTELLSCGADVWVILNKVRSYGPRRLGAAG
jgi:Mrp family chromosome partitioning ATPase